MNETEFWSVIDRATQSATAKTERETTKALAWELLPLSESEIKQWDAYLHGYRDLADTSKMFAAAVVINSGSSDDCFMDFCVWVMMQGRAVYEAALANPDSLAELDLPFEWAEWELCGYAGDYAFELKQQIQFLSADTPDVQALFQKYAHRPNLETEIRQSALDYTMHHRMRPHEWEPDRERKQLEEDVANLLHQYGPVKFLNRGTSPKEHRHLVQQLGRGLVIDREKVWPMDSHALPHIWKKRMAWEEEEELRESQRPHGGGAR